MPAIFSEPVQFFRLFILYFTLFLSLVGTIENSPAIYRWVTCSPVYFSPVGTIENGWLAAGGMYMKNSLVLLVIGRVAAFVGHSSLFPSANLPQRYHNRGEFFFLPYQTTIAAIRNSRLFAQLKSISTGKYQKILHIFPAQNFPLLPELF